MTKRPLEFTRRLRTIYELLHCDIAVYVFNLTASKNFQSFCCGDIDCVRNTAAHHLMTVSLGIVNVFLLYTSAHTQTGPHCHDY